MFTSVDFENNVEKKETFNKKLSRNETDNVVVFKSANQLEVESRQKAIEAIKNRVKNLHW